MLKTLLASFLFLLSFASTSQCLTSLPPPACTGTEPLITDGETISSGTTKWYYGGTAAINSLTLNGGTLVVCGDLTVDKFYMNTGTIFVRQGARFVIGSGIGAGLQFLGNCAIYNYGTCEIRRNLTLENPAAAGTPNIVMNVLSSSVFLMSNQYFVINNAHSRFVNNGRSEFWGIITDAQAAASSVCLGDGSTTKMAILINKVANTYAVPAGNACVHVYQFSEFYGQLTSSSSLLACLGSTHNAATSCIPFGCRPNYWGSAQVFTNCAGCAAIMTALPVRFISFNAVYNDNGTAMLQWATDSGVEEGIFTLLRSSDGKQFIPFDSMPTGRNSFTTFNSTDKHPLQGNNYYMIRHTSINTGLTINSRIVKVISRIAAGLNIYPVPFDEKFFINYATGSTPQKIRLTDIEGRNIQVSYTIRKESQSVEVIALNKLRPGLYMIYMQTDKSVVVQSILKH